jgi:putative tryptophan/tyrosine transport system substrate-binding protein
MTRRAFITLLGSAAMAWPFAARGQQAERMRRLGVLTPLPVDHPDAQARHTAFLKALTQLGWTDGGNVRIEARWSAGDPAITRKHAAELAALAPDIIRGNWQRGRGSNASGDPLRADCVRDRT